MHFRSDAFQMSHMSHTPNPSTRVSRINSEVEAKLITGPYHYKATGIASGSSTKTLTSLIGGHVIDNSKNNHNCHSDIPLLKAELSSLRD